MSANTSIQWTDRTWNPVRGCSRVSAGCDNCYAMNMAHRFSGAGKPFDGLTTIRRGKVDWAGVARFIPEQLGAPLKWRKPSRVFVNSMSDLFHPSLSNEEIAAVFGVMASCPVHTFQVLTKQPKRAAEWFKWVGEFGGVAPYIRHHAKELRSLFGGAVVESYRGRNVRSANDTWARVFNAAAVWSKWPLHNVHLGVSAENQKTANERIPILLGIPVAVRFVSAEPLLEQVTLSSIGIPNAPSPPFSGSALHKARGFENKIDWVIVGGESGPNARPCAVEWIDAVVKQCTAAGVPVFVKQLGAAYEDVLNGIAGASAKVPTDCGIRVTRLKDRAGGDMTEWPDALRVRQFPEASR